MESISTNIKNKMIPKQISDIDTAWITDILHRLEPKWKDYSITSLNLNTSRHSEHITHLILSDQRYTLPPKSLHTFSSVWRKTTLNTGSVGGAGVDPQT